MEWGGRFLACCIHLALAAADGETVTYWGLVKEP